MRARLLTVSSVVLVAATTACNSDDTSTGRFTAELTGPVTQSYDGSALILRDASTGYALAMESDAFQGPAHLSMYLAREATSAPAVGTYDIVEQGGAEPAPDEFVGVIALADNEPDERSCGTVAGTITFTGSSGNGAAGSFEFTMSCAFADDLEGPRETITVTGTFDAPMAINL